MHFDLWQSVNTSFLDPGKYSQSSLVQSVLDHVHQFKLALLLDWQDADEGLVEHSSFRQLGDDLGGLGAAWWWHVDLLGELDVAVLHSKECLVGSHSHLREGGGGQEEVIRECTFSLNLLTICGHRQCYLHELRGDTSLASGLQGCSPHGQSYLVSKGKEVRSPELLSVLALFTHHVRMSLS